MASALESSVVRLRSILGTEFSALDIESHKLKDVIKKHDRAVCKFSDLCVIDTRDHKHQKVLVNGIKDIARAAEHFSVAACNCMFIFNTVDKCPKCCTYYMYRACKHGLEHECADVEISLGDNWLKDCSYMDVSLWRGPRSDHRIFKCICKNMPIDELRSMMMFILEQGEKWSHDNPGVMAGVPERLYEIMEICKDISHPIMKRMTEMASRISSQLASNPVSADRSAPKDDCSEEIIIRCIFNDILSAKMERSVSSNVYKTVKVLRDFNTICGSTPPLRLGPPTGIHFYPRLSNHSKWQPGSTNFSGVSETRQYESYSKGCQCQSYTGWSPCWHTTCVALPHSTQCACAELVWRQFCSREACSSCCP